MHTVLYNNICVHYTHDTCGLFFFYVLVCVCVCSFVAVGVCLYGLHEYKSNFWAITMTKWNFWSTYFTTLKRDGEYNARAHDVCTNNTRAPCSVLSAGNLWNYNTLMVFFFVFYLFVYFFFHFSFLMFPITLRYEHMIFHRTLTLCSVQHACIHYVILCWEILNFRFFFWRKKKKGDLSS